MTELHSPQRKSFTAKAIFGLLLASSWSQRSPPQALPRRGAETSRGEGVP